MRIGMGASCSSCPNYLSSGGIQPFAEVTCVARNLGRQQYIRLSEAVIGNANHCYADTGRNLRKDSRDSLDILLKVCFAVRPDGRDRLRKVDGDHHIDICRLIFGEGFRLIAGGVLIGATLAIVLSRVLSSFLFEVQPNDPAPFIVVGALFVGVGLLACWIPVRRSARVDPLEALRYESLWKLRSRRKARSMRESRSNWN
jgi:hypothetical protein